MQIPIIRTIPARDVVEGKFDAAVWLAGYEERARWLVESEFWPRSVPADATYRVELEEDREILSAPRNRQDAPGLVLGDRPAKKNWDGYWRTCWRACLRARVKRLGRGVDLFVDISSMPRAVYGALLVEAALAQGKLVRSLTLAYVSGQHDKGLDGHRQLDGLRPLSGLEGSSRHEGDPALLIGLGYDGSLAEAVVDLFQADHFSVFYAGPAARQEYVTRCEEANKWIIELAEIVEHAPVSDIAGAMSVIWRLCNWYSETRDVLIIPIGPKTHIVAAILVSMLRPEIGFRSLRTSETRAIQVKVPSGTTPFVSQITFRADEPNQSHDG